MPPIPNPAKKVPMMFRAQIEGRCQLQYVKTQDAVRWTDEWTQEAYSQSPQFGAGVQTRSYQISWRFITNGGQDDGVIRPVIGGKGFPYYPGSSMKGIFRKACKAEAPELCDRYCGSGDKMEPGLLRFHGGYPTSNQWTQNLVDIVHPQQDWQVKTQNTWSKAGGAFLQISLYKPELQFGLSSAIDLEPSEWETIWHVWEKALSMGIGCRVCAGYGQPESHAGDLLYKVYLKGQGAASKLLDGTAEFRPNVFRAALRGHALRIFGGLTEATTAEQLVETLFGGIRKDDGKVGLLSMMFRSLATNIEEFGSGAYQVPTYQIEGELNWFGTQTLPVLEQEALKELVKHLIQFAMVFGGFGKAWRRADHRLFFEEYYDDPNPLIGCHWQWLKGSLLRDVRVRKMEDVGSFIDKVRQAAETWMRSQGSIPNDAQIADWREAWHPDTVQVWGRLAEEADNCEAIRWLHGAYRLALPQARIREGSIYQTSVTGQVNQIGRLWHRMYPVVGQKPHPDDPKKRIPTKTRRYLELLTFFPDDSPASTEFLRYLTSEQKAFQQLW